MFSTSRSMRAGNEGVEVGSLHLQAHHKYTQVHTSQLACDLLPRNQLLISIGVRTVHKKGCTLYRYHHQFRYINAGSKTIIYEEFGININKSVSLIVNHTMRNHYSVISRLVKHTVDPNFDAIGNIKHSLMSRIPYALKFSVHIVPSAPQCLICF